MGSSKDMWFHEQITQGYISGGQTGVDRAGLDAAMEAGLGVGGYVPKAALLKMAKSRTSIR